jgi:hypothetical protein
VVDNACPADGGCPPTHETDCTNRLDDDEDGDVDCDDVDCSQVPACLTSEPEFGVLCVDGVDNDRDGRRDCDDLGCVDHVDCDGAKDWEGDGLTCVDGIDNDRDGLVDCDDPECSAGSNDC